MKTLLIIFVLLAATLAFAGSDYLDYRWAFGIKASNLSGYGAFFGFKPSKEWRVQTTGIYYLLDSELQSEQHVIKGYTMGMEIQRDIIQEARHRIYFMAGSYYYHDDDESKGSTRMHIKKDSYNSGVGIGYEYFFHRVTLGLELGYKIYRDKWKEKQGEGEWVPVTEKVSKLGAGLNLGFVF